MTDHPAIQKAITIQETAKNELEGMPTEVEKWFKSVNFNSWSDTSIGKMGLILVKDPAFHEAYENIHQAFKPNLLMGYFAGWILVVWILRAWRLSKSPTWLTRIWTQCWVSLVSWCGILVMIPWLLWGKSYQMFMATLFRAMIHQFWA